MQLALPVWFEIGTYIVLGLILAFDLILAFKRPHVPSTRESALWIGFYVVLALIFAGLMLVLGDAEHAGQFQPFRVRVRQDGRDGFDGGEFHGRFLS